MQPSINENALEIFKEILDQKEELGCMVIEQSNGTTIIDAGNETPGSIEAGRLIGELCLGGLGAVRLSYMHIEDMTLPSVIVGTALPSIATLGSQHSGWPIAMDNYFAMGSGPARALAFADDVIYTQTEYEDHSKSGVLFLETRELPTENVTNYIAEKCGISSSDLYCVMAPTASKVGSVQISARVLDSGFFRFWKLGLSPQKIRRGYGVAPIASVARNDNVAMGICNDCILYGGSVHLIIRSDEDDDIASMIEEAPFSAASQYGKPFHDLFKAAKYNLYRVDSDVFRPAEITINDIAKDKTYKTGNVDPKLLKQSFGM